MKRSFAACSAAVLATALLATGCANPFKGMTERPLKASPQTLAEIGLPLYPGAKAVDFGGMDIRMVVRSMPVDSMVLVAQTSDPIATVTAWYDAHMPPGSRFINWHFFGFQTVQYQTQSGLTTRQIQLTAVGNTTRIQLTKSEVSTPPPSPGPT